MQVKYDSKGRVLSCGAGEFPGRGQKVVEIPDDDLPDDFLARFAVGKYVIRDGQLTRNPEFTPEDTSRREPFPRAITDAVLREKGSDSEDEPEN